MAKRSGGNTRVGSRLVLSVFVGLVCGFFLGTWSRHSIVPCATDQTRNGIRAGRCCGRAGPGSTNALPRPDEDGNPAEQDVDAESVKKKLVFVGVMTAKKYLSTRVVAAYRTWRSSVPGTVMFFSSEGSSLPEHPEVPIVGLKHVDDSYPPQKKSFMTLKYMHDHFIDQYEWFMRADDDVHIRGEKLSAFLHSINSSRPLFIGQAGMGNQKEIGLLSLDANENFCMGGPGMIFSRSTLKKIVPHISYCLKNLYTTHEDVEIGRCVRKFAEVSCTWAFEMQSLFYHNHRQPGGSFTHSLKTKEVHKAITLHPVKNHTYQYRLHIYFRGYHAQGLRQHVLNMHREISSLNKLLDDSDDPSSEILGVPPTLNKYVPQKVGEVLPWEFLTRYIYSHVHLNPKRGIERPQQKSLGHVLLEVMQMINKNARQRGRTIDFKDILYGYRRVNPLYSADYILDLLLIYRKHKGRRMTVPVRRHAYLQQTFGEMEMREEGQKYGDLPEVQTTPSKSSALLKIFQEKISRLGSFYNTGKGGRQGDSDELAPVKVVHFIMPLAGRYPTFLRFLDNFENECLAYEEKVVLVVVLFYHETEDRTEDVINDMRTLQVKYPQHVLRVLQLKGAFSRGRGLAEGSALFPLNALLFFIDVDIYLNRAFLDRVRSNTIQYEQVYYPIVFSQFDPDVSCDKQDLCPQKTNPYTFTADAGYWRQFGFGIVALYHSDLKAVGGFDLNIEGWGKEDVDLYERFVLSNYTLFRSVDPGLVHIFHAIHCDPQLEPAQYQMCLGTKAASFASLEKLAKMVYDTPAILNKTSTHKGKKPR